MSVNPVSVEAKAVQSSHHRIELVEETFPYHSKSIEDSLRHLGSNYGGLTSGEAQRRLAEKQQDVRHDRETDSRKQMFLKGFKNTITWLLLAAAVLSFARMDIVEGLVILATILANAGIQGFIQMRSERAHHLPEADKADRCDVRRDDRIVTISVDELVRGDILVLNSGHIVPADARLLHCEKLQVDESMLTGESVLVPKDPKALHSPYEDVTAQSNMLFAGTLIKTGKAEAVVAAIGSDSMMGRISELAHDTRKNRSPFASELAVLSRRILLLVLVLSSVVVAWEFYQGADWLVLGQLVLIMTIAALPETLPGIASLILSLGLDRLESQKILVKNLQALETVGDISVVCSDKTGTLTENHLVLDQIYLPEMGALPYDPQWRMNKAIPSRSAEEFLRIARLSSDTMADSLRSALMGDPIDAALNRAAPPELEAGFHRRQLLPFDPVKLRSAALIQVPDGAMVSMIKGAPEAVLETCKYYMKPDGTREPIGLLQRGEFIMFNREVAYENNYRVIGFAEKVITEADQDPFTEATFVGWVCLQDPPKPGVQETVAQFHQAGINMVMITGDQKATAEITAKELGIFKPGSEVWLRAQLEESAGEIPDTVRVFARTKPEEKLYIVECLQQSGHTVAMVGDGVNDAPALQKSDVAIAMGVQGSEAAKDSADILLLSDRLEGIVAAIRESRVLSRKIRSCLQYLLGGNLGLLFFMTAGVLLGMQQPLTAVQVLWMSFVVNILPTLVLAVEPVPEESLASRADVQKELLTPTQSFLLFYWGIWTMLAGVGAYFLTTLVFHQSEPVAHTMAFATLGLSLAFNLFNIQFANAKGNLQAFWAEMAQMPVTWLLVGAVLILQMGSIFVPGINHVLHLSAIPLTLLPLPLGIALVALFVSSKLVDFSR